MAIPASDAADTLIGVGFAWLPFLIRLARTRRGLHITLMGLLRRQGKVDQQPLHLS